MHAMHVTVCVTHIHINRTNLAIDLSLFSPFFSALVFWRKIPCDLCDDSLRVVTLIDIIII